MEGNAAPTGEGTVIAVASFVTEVAISEHLGHINDFDVDYGSSWEPESLADIRCQNLKARFKLATLDWREMSSAHSSLVFLETWWMPSLLVILG